jgi:hypothetical protein
MARHRQAQAPRVAAQFRAYNTGSLVNILSGSRNLNGITDDYTYTENSVARRINPIAVNISGAGTAIVSGIDLRTNGEYQVSVTGTYADWNGFGGNDWFLYSLTPRSPITISGTTYTAFDLGSGYLKFASTSTSSGGTFAYNQQQYLTTQVYAVGFTMVSGTSQENLGFDLTITITPVET